MGAFEDMLAKRALAAADPSFAGGSSYFAQRSATLDPSLFEEGDHLQWTVRETVMHRWLAWCEQQRLLAPTAWSRLWLAGSGITTAWDAGREADGEPGDLDCLIGIDYAALGTTNPAWAGSPPDAIARELNQSMHDTLWPSTGHTRFGATVYELTYYVNPGVGAGPNDLLAINPYAAYDVTADSWTLHPVQVPEGFSADYFNRAARDQVAADHQGALVAVQEFNDARAAVQRTPRDLGALRRLHDAVARGAARFDAIHDGRKVAFAPGGKGYFDVANFRWQAGKASGAVGALRALKQLDEQAHADQGRPCDDVQHLLLVGSMANGGRRFR